MNLELLSRLNGRKLSVYYLLLALSPNPIFTQGIMILSSP
jgi:hypothetical protein